MSGFIQPPGVTQVRAGSNIFLNPSSGVGVVSIAASGGGGSDVTSIIAGTNITIDPPDGQGDVTINSTGGGGGGSQPLFFQRATTMFIHPVTIVPFAVFSYILPPNSATRVEAYIMWATNDANIAPRFSYNPGDFGLFGNVATIQTNLSLPAQTAPTYTITGDTASTSVGLMATLSGVAVNTSLTDSFTIQVLAEATVGPGTSTLTIFENDTTFIVTTLTDS